MPTYEVRNRRSKMVLGEVTVDDSEKVIDALLDATGATMEEFALSLGGTMGEITKALDIVEVKLAAAPIEKGRATKPLAKTMPPRRHLLYTDRE